MDIKDMKKHFAKQAAPPRTKGGKPAMKSDLKKVADAATKSLKNVAKLR